MDLVRKIGIKIFNKIGARLGNNYLRNLPGVEKFYYTLKRLVAGSDRLTEYHGVQVFVDPVDEIGGRIILERHEPKVVQLIGDLLPKGGTFVDVGSHYGAMTAIGADAVGSDGKVIAIEPNPKTLTYLEQTIHSNEFQDRVDIIPIAVGADSGETSLHIPKSSGRVHTAARVATNRTTASKEVKQSTLHNIIEERKENIGNVNLMKIDVEGAELAALHGLKQSIDYIDNLCVEIHAGKRIEMKNILQWLQERGDVRKLDGTGVTPADLPATVVVNLSEDQTETLSHAD